MIELIFKGTKRYYGWMTALLAVIGVGFACYLSDSFKSFVGIAVYEHIYIIDKNGFISSVTINIADSHSFDPRLKFSASPSYGRCFSLFHRSAVSV